MRRFVQTPFIYRILAGLSLAVVIVLAITLPNRLMEPDDWAYYYAAENFSHGHLVIDNQLHNQQVAEARNRGGSLIQYVEIGPDRWALEKAPGTVFFMVPFHLLGIPGAANILLAIGVTITIYLLLKRLRDEKTACIGAALMLFTTVFLVMLYRYYMDTFSGSAFLFIGGGLYIYYVLDEQRTVTIGRGLLLSFAFFCISWSVVARYTNLPIAVVFALHYAITRLQQGLGKGWRPVIPEILPVALGAGIPLVILLGYHTVVFGSPFTYGYTYTKLPIKFAFQYFGQTDPKGHSIVMNIIKGNLNTVPQTLFIGFPALVIALPALVYAVFQKARLLFKRRVSNRLLQLPSHILWLLIGWFVCVFPLYLLYEWTAQQGESRPFIIIARFYLPGLMPLAIIASLVITRWVKKLTIIILVLYVVMSSSISAQSAIAGMSQPASPAVQQQLSSQQAPVLQQPGISPEVIERTRQEVKSTPTTAQNVEFRLNVLRAWIASLNSQGVKIGQVFPPERLQKIEELIKNGSRQEAARLVDSAYRDLETPVSGK